MSEMDFETRLHSIAKQMDYPPTPDIAGRVMLRVRHVTKSRFITKGWAWSLTVVFVLFFSLMLIPPARAAIIEFIQIGIVRIFPRPSETPIDPIQTATPYLESSTLLVDLSQLAGERTLSQAQNLVAPYYSISLPFYPPELGEPDYVFVQDADGAMTILVWLDPNDPERVLMSLHFIPEGSWAIMKFDPIIIQETKVNDLRAGWAVGPYPLWLSNGDLEFIRLIEGHVLIWAVDNVTYRLETNLPLEEAIKVAESLKPIP